MGVLNTHVQLEEESTVGTRQTQQGILLIVLGLVIAASTGAIMKLLSDDFSAYQISWLRFTGFAIIMLPLVLLKFGRSALRPPRPAVQVFRGISMAGGTVFFVIGAHTIDFADAIAILYAYPFLLTVLAVFFLQERVRWIGWIGVSGGFIGVLLVMRPEFETINAGSLFVFLCAVIVSIQMVMNRKLGAVSHPFITSFWGTTIAACTLTFVIPFSWKPIGSEHLGLILLMILSGAISQILIVFAFAKSVASTLAPFTYFEIIAAVAIGYIVFDTLPDWVSWLGILLIVVSGLIVAHSLPGRHTPRRTPKI